MTGRRSGPVPPHRRWPARRGSAGDPPRKRDDIHPAAGPGPGPGVSADQLLGLEKPPRNGRVRDTRLWRRFRQVEQLPPAERKPIVQLVDAFLRGEMAAGGS